MAATRAYREGVLLAEGFPVEEISDRLRDPDTVVWVDLCMPTQDDLRLIGEELGLDALAVEDAVSRHERPKVDHYEGYLSSTPTPRCSRLVSASWVHKRPSERDVDR